MSKAYWDIYRQTKARNPSRRAPTIRKYTKLELQTRKCKGVIDHEMVSRGGKAKYGSEKIAPTPAKKRAPRKKKRTRPVPMAAMSPERQRTPPLPPNIDTAPMTPGSPPPVARRHDFSGMGGPQTAKPMSGRMKGEINNAMRMGMSRAEAFVEAHENEARRVAADEHRRKQKARQERVSDDEGRDEEKTEVDRTRDEEEEKRGDLGLIRTPGGEPAQGNNAKRKLPVEMRRQIHAIKAREVREKKSLPSALQKQIQGREPRELRESRALPAEMQREIQAVQARPVREKKALGKELQKEIRDSKQPEGAFGAAERADARTASDFIDIDMEPYIDSKGFFRYEKFVNMMSEAGAVMGIGPTYVGGFARSSEKGVEQLVMWMEILGLDDYI